MADVDICTINDDKEGSIINNKYMTELMKGE